MFNLAKRNVKLFFRDRASVFFSLLGVIIIIGLYILFLGDMMQSGMDEVKGVRFLMDSWIMAGMLAAAGMTTTLGAMGTMVDDRSTGRLKDFYAAPVRRADITGGYMLSSMFIGFIMSLIAFVFAEIYIVAYGGQILPLLSILKMIGLLFLSVLSSSSMIYFLVSFFKTSNAFAAASTVIGTMIGFLTGIYIPIGTLPGAVQWVIRIFPVSHTGVLMRQVMMEAPLAASFAGAPEAMVTAFKQEMGVEFTYGSYTMEPWGHILVLVITTILFFGLSVWRLSKRKNTWK